MQQDTLAQDHRLGGFIRTHKFSTVRMLASLITWLLYGAFFTFVFVMAWRQSGFESWMIVALLLPLAGWGGALEVIVSTIRNWGMQLDLYQHGFIFRERKGVHAMRWDDVADFKFKHGLTSIKGIIPVVIQYRIEIRCKDGETFVIRRQLQKIREIGPIIIENLGKAMMPDAVERLKQGETLDFGKFKVERDALLVGDRRFEWREIKSFGVHESAVDLRLKQNIKIGLLDRLKRGFFYRVNPDKIPNVTLLLELVNLFLGESRAKGEAR